MWTVGVLNALGSVVSPRASLEVVEQPLAVWSPERRGVRSWLRR